MRSIKSSVLYALVCLSTILPTAYSYPIDSTAVASVKYQLLNRDSLQPISGMKPWVHGHIRATVEHLASTKLDGVGADPSIDYEVDNPEDDPRPFAKEDGDGVQILHYTYQFMPGTVHHTRSAAICRYCLGFLKIEHDPHADASQLDCSKSNMDIYRIKPGTMDVLELELHIGPTRARSSVEGCASRCWSYCSA
ncbi:hypothetical protein FB446DRAFT_90799 [Lentinula raphanica]|nr:hypothetical protein FB446DRAFT_90799 [Lentinula raphanica]